MIIEEFKKQTTKNFKKQQNSQKTKWRVNEKIDKWLVSDILENYFQHGYVTFVEQTDLKFVYCEHKKSKI